MKTEDLIIQVVQAFYEKAKSDVLIGYHFRIIPDFELHIPRIAAFWEIQLQGKTNRTLEAPFDILKVHLPLNIKRGELGRWLVLFKKTLEEQPVPDELKTLWLERLDFFEERFLRFFSFK
jgi:hemoglobin